MLHGREMTRWANRVTSHREKRRGFFHSPAGLRVAKKTIENFIEKASRLYEKERSAVSRAAALDEHVRRWLGWANRTIRSSVSGQQHRAENAVAV